MSGACSFGTSLIAVEATSTQGRHFWPRFVEAGDSKSVLLVRVHCVVSESVFGCRRAKGVVSVKFLGPFCSVRHAGGPSAFNKTFGLRNTGAIRTPECRKTGDRKKDSPEKSSDRRSALSCDGLCFHLKF